MSTAHQSFHAAGTKGECRADRVRHTVTLDRSVFDDLRAAAVANCRSVSEEMAARLKTGTDAGQVVASREVRIANPGP
jgi:hypothetical protein